MSRSPDLSLAELLAGLSLVTDLAARHPAEQALRACILATHLAETMGLGDDQASHAYYNWLLVVSISVVRAAGVRSARPASA